MPVTLDKTPSVVASPMVGAPPWTAEEIADWEIAEWELADVAAPDGDGLAAEIDALGALGREVEAARALVKDYEQRVQAVLARLRAARETNHAGAAFEASVDETVVNRREIVDLPRILVQLGPETFMQLASIRLGDLDKYLDESQKADVLKTTPTVSYALAITPRHKSA